MTRHRAKGKVNAGKCERKKRKKTNKRASIEKGERESSGEAIHSLELFDREVDRHALKSGPVEVGVCQDN
jgi:hypothetical protein